MMDKNDLNLAEIHCGGDYESEFEYDERKSKRKKYSYDDLPVKQKPISRPNKNEVVEEFSKEHGRLRRYQFLAKDAYSRHKELINHYLLCYPGSTSKLQRDRSKDKTDIDVIRENHQFLWEEEEEEADTWEKKLAKKYYDKLFKEYCLADLSRYKENKVALRWRTESELIKGTGQFSCGNIHCNDKGSLTSWEVNFGYVEHGEKKNALVKLRLCPKCSYKLNYHHKRKKAKKSNLLPSHDSSSSQPETTKDGNENGTTIPPTSSVSEAGTSDQTESSTDSSNIWKQSHQEECDTKTRDDEFEVYLAEMLL